MSVRFSAAMLLCAVGLFAPVICQGQTPSGSFPFVIPWDDSLPGTATDLSFLNDKPAGSGGYIVARDGHFYESQSGRRIRFLGAAFVATAAFPLHSDADKVAARLSKLGVNIVRIHHIDGIIWAQPGSIWDLSAGDMQHIDSAQLDKLDYLVAQFKKHGIYVDLNLHVSRQFTAADGFPASIAQVPFDFDKRVDNFDSRMIALQKQYAHDLLTHVNPYTGLSYADDPCVAVVEINNENSLVGDPWATVLGDGLDALPEPFKGEIVAHWNNWLTRKYAVQDTLRTAWSAGFAPPGPAMLHPESAWTLEQQSTTSASLQKDEVQSDTAPPITVTVTKVDGTSWHVQVDQTGLDLQNGVTYMLSFRAKADTVRTVNVSALIDESDWHNVGLETTANLTPTWQNYHFVFQAHDVVPGHGRFSISMGDQTGQVSLDHVQLRSGVDMDSILAGQSLADHTVGIPTTVAGRQWQDWIAFLSQVERDYADEMRAYLKSTLKIHANVIDSQISWGGIAGLNREADMDFADNHAYWQHPQFPGKAWDMQNWLIGNTPMVADLATGGGGTFRDLVEYRVAGKPYTISEYNEPAPNDFQCEAVPELLSFAALQDWDAIYMFDYGDYGVVAKNDAIQDYFSIDSNPAKAAFMPSAALLFRGGEIAPAGGADILSINTAALTSGKKASDLWSAAGQAKPDMFDRRIAISDSAEFTSTPALQTATQAKVSGDFSSALYEATSPSARVLIGFVGGRSINTDGVLFDFPQFGDNFASVTLVSLDRLPIGQSKRLLLTAVGKVENTDMVWNAAHNSVEDQWGHGPTLAEGIPSTVTVTVAGPRHVYALNPQGARDHEVQSHFAVMGESRRGRVQFTIGPDDKTLWYEIAP